MRYLIVSDLHANLESLKAVLSAVENRYDRVVCCGDLVGYGPDPNPVVDWVRANAVAVIRGNHDKACCGVTEAEDFNQVARTAALWTRQRLTAENLAYLRALPAGPLEVDGFQIVHGSVQDEDEYLYNVADARADVFKQMKAVAWNLSVRNPLPSPRTSCQLGKKQLCGPSSSR